MIDFFQLPDILKNQFRSVEWEGESNENNLYLTFDDGPTPDLCPFILDSLKPYDAKATFFCVGENAMKHPELLERMNSEGHTTGNHTFRHLNGWRTGTGTYIADVLKCSEYVKSDLFRPPYGKLWFPHIRELRKNGFRIILWSILSYDFHPKVKPIQILNYIKKNAKAGDIIVFHDNLKAVNNLKKILPCLLDHLTEKGFKLSALK